MKQPLLYLAFLALSATGCMSGSEEGKLAPPKAFFDLKGYIEGEVQHLSETQPQVIKRIAIDGESEEKTFDSLDYQKELSLFSRSDINKIAWLDKYKADSVFQDGQLTEVAYTTTDKGLKTQRLEVQFSSGQVSQVHIQNRTESLVADVGQEIWYYPGKGYRMESRQSTTLTEEKKVTVEVEFLE